MNCPVCNAPPEVPCRTPGGTFLPTRHDPAEAISILRDQVDRLQIANTEEVERRRAAEARAKAAEDAILAFAMWMTKR